MGGLVFMAVTIHLYSFADFDRSSRVRWLLHELKLQYTEKRMHLGEQKKDDYLSLNPFAKIPCIEIDGNVIFESGAIFFYLLHKYPGHNLIPLGLMNKASLLNDYPNLLQYMRSHESRQSAIDAKVFTSQIVKIPK